MYKLFKPKGYNTNVSVENTETSASIIIGRLSMEVLNILEKTGHKLENYTEEINLDISETAAKELSSLALKMKRPTRKRVETKPVKHEEPKEEEIEVDATTDAFDLIFGKI